MFKIFQIILKMGSKENKVNCVLKFITALLKLLDKNIPVLAFWQHNGELKKIGTGKMSKWFDNFDDKTKESLSVAMFDDMLTLNNNEESLIVQLAELPQVDRASALLKSLTNFTRESGIPMLPFPLSLMSQKEKMKYVGDLIGSEAKKDKVHLKFGDENWRPSFWQEDVWEWTKLDKSIRLYRETSYTGQGSFSQFLDRTIAFIFSKKGLDTESHVVELELKENRIKKKERNRGVFKNPMIYRTNVDVENNADYCNEDDSDDSNNNCPESSISMEGQVDVDGSEFRPRRPMSDSPFKTGGSSNSLHCPIPMGDLMGDCVSSIESHEEINNIANNMREYEEIPDQLIHELGGGFRIQHNSGGGSCFYKAVAQHISNNKSGANVCYLELRKYAHEKIMQWWENLQMYFTWPMQVTIGTGERRREKELGSPEEYHQFLSSAESLESYTESEIDVWVMSYILNKTISVLTYNLPEGQGKDGSRFSWAHYYGDGVVSDPQSEIYHCGPSCLFLLTEHLQHWSLMETLDYWDLPSHGIPTVNYESNNDEVVDADSDKSLQSSATYTNLENVNPLFLDQNLTIDGKEQPITSNTDLFSKRNVKRRKRSTVDLCSTVRGKKTKFPDLSNNLTVKRRKTKKAREALTKISTEEIDEPLKTLLHTSGKPVRDTIRNLNDPIVGLKSDIYFVVSSNDVSLEKMLEPLDRKALIEEARLNDIDVRIAKCREEHEREMNKIEESIRKNKQVLKDTRRRFRLNRTRRDEMEAGLSKADMKMLFQSNKDYFLKIFSGEIFSKRRVEYMKGGKHRDRLRNHSFTPFTEAHLSGIFEELELIWLRNEDEKRENFNFVWSVMLPEVFIKVKLCIV